MRKILLLAFMIIPLVFFGILILKNINTNPQKSSAESNTEATAVPESSINIESYKWAWFEADKIDELKLISNFEKKLTSSELISKNSCRFLSSAGFYGLDNKPIGLFISDKNKIGNYQDNNLFDGILSVNDMATPRITRNIPQDSLKIALQTGPILKENSFFQDLRIKGDKPSRRVIAGITGENKLFFVIVWDPKSEYSGPNLADLPHLLDGFEKETGIIFADAINMDGGSASSFYNTATK